MFSILRLAKDIFRNWMISPSYLLPFIPIWSFRRGVLASALLPAGAEYACRVEVTRGGRCGEIDTRKSKISLSRRGYCYPPTRSMCLYRHDRDGLECEEIVCTRTDSGSPVLDMTEATRLEVDPAINPGVKIIYRSMGCIICLF